MTAQLGPLAGFPRWTGARATLGPISRAADGSLAADVDVYLTRRAYLWARWRILRGRWGRDAAA